MSNKVDPREELASAKAAIRCASHSMGLACDKLNSLAHCFADDSALQSLADRGSLALTAINALEHEGRQLTRKVRAWAGPIPQPESVSEHELALRRIVEMYEPRTSARDLAQHVLLGGTVKSWRE